MAANRSTGISSATPIWRSETMPADARQMLAGQRLTRERLRARQQTLQASAKRLVPTLCLPDGKPAERFVLLPFPEGEAGLLAEQVAEFGLEAPALRILAAQQVVA